MPGPQPDLAYFDVMARQARTHWWYVGRRRLVAELLAGRLAPGSRVLDVGCGTGDNLDMLGAAAAGIAIGAELSWYAVNRARDDADRLVTVAFAEALPFRSASADLVSSMDVVEHLDNDVTALREYFRVLRPGGLLLLTVPAYQWLWSDHDVWAAHRRRYNASELVTAAESAGFTVRRTTYFNSFLVPPAVLLRRTPLRRLVRTSNDEAGAASPTLSRVMRGLSGAERRLARRRRLPLGLSILLLADRPW